MHGIYFSANNDNEGFRLPVNPEKVDVISEGDGEEFTISRLGNINIPKDIMLEEYSLDGYFPFVQSPYQVAEFKKPQYYINLFKKWQKNKWPVRYIYVKGSFAINELTTIESFEYEESDGSGDVYFTLSLKKYVPFGPKKMKIVLKKSSINTVAKKKAPPRQNNKSKPKTYTLVSGDSLWKVAQKYTGNGSNYPALAKLNNIKPSQYRKLPIGLKLKLPSNW